MALPVRVVACALTLLILQSAAKAATNLLANPGAETGDLTGWTPAGPGTPIADNGTFNPGITPHTGNFDFLGHDGASATLTQRIDLFAAGFTPEQIAAGTAIATFSFWEISLNQGASDAAYVALRMYNSLNLVQVDIPGEQSNVGSWGFFQDSITLVPDVQYIDYVQTFVRHSGSDLDAYLDDNFLSVSVPEPTTLSLLALAFPTLLRPRSKRAPRA